MHPDDIVEFTVPWADKTEQITTFPNFGATPKNPPKRWCYNTVLVDFKRNKGGTVTIQIRWEEILNRHIESSYVTVVKKATQGN